MARERIVIEVDLEIDGQDPHRGTMHVIDVKAASNGGGMIPMTRMDIPEVVYIIRQTIEHTLTLEVQDTLSAPDELDDDPEPSDWWDDNQWHEGRSWL